jgi:hypothetical protein
VGDTIEAHSTRGSGPTADIIEEGVEPIGRIEAGRLGECDLVKSIGPGSISRMT